MTLQMTTEESRCMLVACKNVGVTTQFVGCEIWWLTVFQPRRGHGDHLQEGA